MNTLSTIPFLRLIVAAINWIEKTRIQIQLNQAHRDADVLIAQIKNDTLALSEVSKEQVKLAAKLRGIN